MLLKAVVKGEGGWFTPDVGDNRKNTKDPFRVWVVPLTYDQKNQLEVEHLGEPLRRGRTESFMVRAQRLIGSTFAQHVTKVENCVVDFGNGQSMKPRNGAELLQALGNLEDSVAEPIIAQIDEALRDRTKLDEEMAKKFSSPLPSTSQETSGDGAGAVQAAGSQAS